LTSKAFHHFRKKNLSTPARGKESRLEQRVVRVCTPGGRRKHQHPTQRKKKHLAPPRQLGRKIPGLKRRATHTKKARGPHERNNKGETYSTNTEKRRRTGPCTSAGIKGGEIREGNYRGDSEQEKTKKNIPTKWKTVGVNSKRKTKENSCFSSRDRDLMRRRGGEEVERKQEKSNFNKRNTQGPFPKGGGTALQTKKGGINLTRIPDVGKRHHTRKRVCASPNQREKSKLSHCNTRKKQKNPFSRNSGELGGGREKKRAVRVSKEKNILSGLYTTRSWAVSTKEHQMQEKENLPYEGGRTARGQSEAPSPSTK